MKDTWQRGATESRGRQYDRDDDPPRRARSLSHGPHPESNIFGMHDVYGSSFTALQTRSTSQASHRQISSQGPQPQIQDIRVNEDKPPGWSNYQLGSKSRTVLTAVQERRYRGYLGVRVHCGSHADTYRADPSASSTAARLFDADSPFQGQSPPFFFSATQRLNGRPWNWYHPVTEQIPPPSPPIVIPQPSDFREFHTVDWPQWAARQFTGGPHALSRSRAGMIIKEKARLSGRIMPLAWWTNEYQYKVIFCMSANFTVFYLLLDAEAIFRFRGRYESPEDFFAKHAYGNSDLVSMPGSTVEVMAAQDILATAFRLCGGDVRDLQLSMARGVKWWDYFETHGLESLLTPDHFAEMAKLERAAERVIAMEESNG
ncbi:hypothetical protein C8R47DRAFT_1085457 [Mycena vitilis]|nr:hypothetical protein C8R47DRAFT_1085457 [Mycena vitilis]